VIVTPSEQLGGNVIVTGRKRVARVAMTVIGAAGMKNGIGGGIAKMVMNVRWCRTG
jgi:hypothetical protein